MKLSRKRRKKSVIVTSHFPFLSFNKSIHTMLHAVKISHQTLIYSDCLCIRMMTEPVNFNLEFIWLVSDVASRMKWNSHATLLDVANVFGMMCFFSAQKILAKNFFSVSKWKVTGRKIHRSKGKWNEDFFMHIRFKLSLKGPRITWTRLINCLPFDFNFESVMQRIDLLFSAEISNRCSTLLIFFHSSNLQMNLSYEFHAWKDQREGPNSLNIFL